MAKAGTTEWEHGLFPFGKCDKCSGKVNHRKFYYPTYFNGDAETLKSLCDNCYKLKSNRK